MKKQFTKKYILENSGCYSTGKTKELLKGSKSPIALKTILSDFPIPLKDKFWFLFAKCNINKQVKIDLAYELAVVVAVVVAVIYNKKYPKDSRVNNCLKAIRDFKAGKITRQELRTAAYAYAAYAAYAYAYAAYAADDADDADADAYAADAYAAAAYAYAAYAAHDADAYAAAYAYAAYAADAADAYAADDAAYAIKGELINKIIKHLKL